MKTFFVLCTIACISIAYLFLDGNNHPHLKNSNAEHAALILADLTDSSLDPYKVEAYLNLLKNDTSMTAVNPSLKIKDFAVTALEIQTKIKATTENRAIKAILSCIKNGHIYRYHIADLTSQQRADFQLKVSKWLQEKITQ